ncbi:hypothetical protein [Streptomyces sp. CA-253872]|uniref:hypothetical protein n=1 Tax=Streptomyces sp. CA-253872 TaxID=3240067 RepID=UPI003D94E19A
MSTVRGCRCSAATTPDTAAWRSALVTATLQASELPLPEPIETVMRALAAGPDARDGLHDPHGLVLALQLRGFAQTRDGALDVTDAGRAYLAARIGPRVAVGARVSSLDPAANRARLLVDMPRPDQAVVVLLDQVLHATGLDPHELPGRALDVVCNPFAPPGEPIVLTGMRLAAPAAPALVASVEVRTQEGALRS